MSFAAHSGSIAPPIAQPAQRHTNAKAQSFGKRQQIIQRMLAQQQHMADSKARQRQAQPLHKSAFIYWRSFRQLCDVSLDAADDAVLPLRFTLDDSTSMGPAARLSSARQVIVGARISKSGNAVPQPGDLQGYSKPVAVGASGLTIEIAEEVK